MAHVSHDSMEQQSKVDTNQQISQNKEFKIS